MATELVFDLLQHYILQILAVSIERAERHGNQDSRTFSYQPFLKVLKGFLDVVDHAIEASDAPEELRVPR